MTLAETQGSLVFIFKLIPVSEGPEESEECDSDGYLTAGVRVDENLEKQWFFLSQK